MKHPPDSITKKVDQVGIAACSPLQTNCHSSLVVVPCISECSHFKSCLPSLYDDVALITQSLTQEYDNVEYTVVWDWGVPSLPSIIENNNISAKKAKYCNLEPLFLRIASYTNSLRNNENRITKLLMMQINLFTC